VIAVITLADVMEARTNGLLTPPVLTLEVAGGELRSLGTSTAEDGRSAIPAAA